MTKIHLIAEGVAKEKIDLIGNIMIDSFEMLKARVESANTQEKLGLDAGAYALVTLHRPSNVDNIKDLEPIVDELVQISNDIPVVFVAHPRTIKSLDTFGLKDRLTSSGQISLLDPLPYVS